MGFFAKRAMVKSAPDMAMYASRDSSTFKTHESKVFTGAAPKTTLLPAFSLGVCENDRNEVSIPMAAAYSAFVSGVPGTGKTTELFTIAVGAAKAGVPVLVLECASKLEFAKALLPNVSNCEVLGGGPACGNAALRFNPMAPVPGTIVGSHAQDVADAFVLAADNKPEAPLPQVVYEAVVISYLRHGWRLDEIAYDDPGRAWPTIPEIAECAQQVLTCSTYEPKVVGNVGGAVNARLRYLMAHNSALVGTSLNLARLVGGNAVLELSNYGDNTVAFFVQSILSTLVELAAVLPEATGVPRLVVVIDELNVVLQKDDPVNKPIHRLLARAYREFRSKGICLVTAMQNPSECAEVVANSAVKIAYRSDFEDDVEVIARSFGLEDNQRDALRRLQSFHAIAKLPVGDMEAIPLRASRPELAPATALHAACAACQARVACKRVKQQALAAMQDLDAGAVEELEHAATELLYKPDAVARARERATSALPGGVKDCALGHALMRRGVPFEEARRVFKQTRAE